MPELSVSIITPSYNQGRFIQETIQSVLAQDVKEIEYLVVDGNSTDETVEILRQHQHRLKWVSEKDQGQADAVNKGLLQTSGEVIGWLNSDDVYYPHAVARVCHFFQENPNIDVVYGRASQLDEAGNKRFEDYLTEPWNLNKLKVNCFLSQPAVFFRRRVLSQYGLLDPQLHFCLDYEYWLRLGLKGANFAYLPEILAGSRIYPQTKSSRFYLQAHFETINMLQRTLGYIPPEWIVNYSTAKVKTESHCSYPHPKFILNSWLNLWKATGLHNHGIPHLQTWLAAQKMMVKKFFAKTFMENSLI